MSAADPVGLMILLVLAVIFLVSTLDAARFARLVSARLASRSQHWFASTVVAVALAAVLLKVYRDGVALNYADILRGVFVDH